MSGPTVAAMPVRESGERLVDVRRGGSPHVGTRKQESADTGTHPAGQRPGAAA
ncbi:hypothetical protein [Streptomyces sp. MI02-7b]|uniref:hypothetical protein n=1 Tax=Streptomyces sp. MI02-7b TaxID=462941 RepID=UPI0029AEFD35|nr:hypothetical protein [Streptomyces sp. MI02-7b]MDX3072170.1 hypothetical protein [Streptomyces sp. MI02-7b]